LAADDETAAQEDGSVTQHSVKHATFTVERTYDAPPQRVWRAWSTRDEKAAWFNGPEDWGPVEYELDFRVGGREVNSGGPPGGPSFTYEATYRDIVPGERFIYAYDMYADDVRISVSLGTVELAPAGSGTRLTYTEQAAMLDGLDTVEQRERGTIELLDALGRALAAERTTA
jgi:uncharacterized protein YndB with AHSA1/START domain